MFGTLSHWKEREKNIGGGGMCSRMGEAKVKCWNSNNCQWVDIQGFQLLPEKS